MKYLAHDIAKKNRLLKKGSIVTDLVQISFNPILWAGTVNGERWCFGNEDFE